MAPYMATKVSLDFKFQNVTKFQKLHWDKLFFKSGCSNGVCIIISDLCFRIFKVDSEFSSSHCK